MADGSSNLEIIISAVDEASAAFDEINASLEGVAETVAESTAAADASLTELQTNVARTGTAVGLSYDQMAELIAQDDAEIQQIILDLGVSAQEAAAIQEEANAAIAASADETAAAVTASSNLTKGSFMTIGIAAGIAFAAVSSSVSNAISSAQAWDEESAIIAQTLKATASAIPLSEVQAYAQHVQSVTLLTQQEALQAEGLILTNQNLQDSYQSLTLLAADLATKMAQTSGTLSDNLPNATKILTNALADPVAGLNQLIRQGTINFPAATVTMIQNMAKVGDTAAADALIIKTLESQVHGMAQAAAQAPGGGITQLNNSLTALGTQIGNALLPDLVAIANALVPIITGIANWVQEHPKLTEAIVIGTTAFTALLAVLTVLGIIIAAVGSAFLAAGLGIAAVSAVIAVTVVQNWNLIANVTQTVFNGIVAFFQTMWNATKTLFTASLGAIKIIWETAWTDMSGLLTTIWQTIENTVKTGVNFVINAINGLINALDAIHISIPAIQIPGTKIGSPALNLGFNIPDIPLLAAGGIVNEPTLAFIGESGPEAVIPLSSAGSPGGGQQIIIQIQGGIFPADDSTLNMIGNKLAKVVLRGLRPVTNYAL